jgi:CIC family chloride channel protein
MEPWQRITLVAAGAGAGIAATFNTPIGGVMFAIELMLPEVSVRTFLPVALATGTATFIAQFVLGLRPAFEVPTRFILSNHPAPLYAFVLYALLGGAMGLAATGFIRGLHYSEGAFERMRNPYMRHAIGMLFVGIIMYAFLRASGRYHIEGVGYSTVQDVLVGGIVTAPFLVALFVGKLTGTLLSLGSGSSGGIFSPSLFMGATLGAVFGAVVHLLISTPDMPFAAFAMIGGATGAAMTAVTMIFEMTRDYNIVMPMIVAVAVSIGIRRVLSTENIYTIKLVARRHFIPKSMHANMFLVRQAGDVMEKEFLILSGDIRFDQLLNMPSQRGKLRYVVVTEGGAILGALRVNTVLRHGLEDAYTGLTLREIANRDFVIARDDDIMFNVIERMWRRKASMIIVARGNGETQDANVLGVITKDHLADSVLASVRPYFGAEPIS